MMKTSAHPVLVAVLPALLLLHATAPAGAQMPPVTLLGQDSGIVQGQPSGPVAPPPFLDPGKGPVLPPGPPAPPMPPSVMGVVKVRTTLNVRTSPWGPIIGSLGPDSRVQIIGQQGDWFVIAYKGRTAFVHSDYVLTPANSPLGTRGVGQSLVVAPTGTTMRHTPWGVPAGSIPAGTPVALLGRTRSWALVGAGNQVGLVPFSHLAHGPYIAGGAAQGYPVVPRPPAFASYAAGGPAPAVPGPGGRFAFPVAGPSRFGNDFGVGTHSFGASPYNVGIDIFAARGTPVVSPVDGVVKQVSVNRLGGRTVHVVGPDGTDYYFAHMDGYAPGLRPGLRIAAGTPLGSVGDTGNAKGTPPHLHFAAVKGGRAWNPYPILRASRGQSV